MLGGKWFLNKSHDTFSSETMSFVLVLRYKDNFVIAFSCNCKVGNDWFKVGLVCLALMESDLYLDECPSVERDKPP